MEQERLLFDKPILIQISYIAQMLDTSISKARSKMQRAGIYKGGYVGLEDFIEWVEAHPKSSHYYQCIAGIQAIEKKILKRNPIGKRQDAVKIIRGVGGKAFPKDFNWICNICHGTNRAYETECNNCYYEARIQGFRGIEAIYPKNPKEKLMTVYKRYYDAEFKKGMYPEIRLTGHWLTKYGTFHPHDKFRAQVSPKRIIITKNPTLTASQMGHYIVEIREKIKTLLAHGFELEGIKYDFKKQLLDNGYDPIQVNRIIKKASYNLK